jgi:Mg2+/Co2+ transporter CorB
MASIPLSTLFVALGILIVLSALFSGSETALMTVNRYRLRHLAKAGHRGAQVAERLLERPDRLIGLILLGNNLVNFTASSLATLIALRIGGEAAVAIAVGIFTLVVLIFAEVLPKTLAALRPEGLAFGAAWVYSPLLKITYPLVWAINMVANSVLRVFGIRADDTNLSHLSSEELRTVVMEAGAMIPKRHQKMLLSILDLEKVTVEDIMVPRAEIIGVDLSQDWDEVVAQLLECQHSRLPVWDGDIDEILGIIHLRRLLRPLARGELTRDQLMQLVREPYFVPEGTPLNKQLLNFQHLKRRVALVVDEYGDLLGLVTLEDLLEEIVGEFTSDPAAAARDFFPEDDGSFLVNGTANIRQLNRALKMQLATGGPKTLNGLVIEHMEAIPDPGTCMLLSGYPVEIVAISGNQVKTARIRPWKVQSATALPSL